VAGGSVAGAAPSALVTDGAAGPGSVVGALLAGVAAGWLAAAAGLALTAAGALVARGVAAGGTGGSRPQAASVLASSTAARTGRPTPGACGAGRE